MMFRLIVIAFVLGFASDAMAADEPVVDDTEVFEEEPFEPSKYGSLGLAIGVDQFNRFDPVDFGKTNVGDRIDSTRVEPNEGIGLDLVFGYRWHKNASVEAQFVYMQGLDDNNASFRTSANRSGTGRAKVEYQAFTANLKLYPVPGRVEPYAFAGVGAGLFLVNPENGKDSEWGNVFRLGAGVELNYTKSLAVSIGGAYLFTRGDLDGRDMLEFKLGVISRFW